ncbi:hypothetical protein HanHA300_Chr13g0496931 [Helianthus annuus]|nr:hypothetical protein HanHA300_Chr13g0496931 [Helianthus annuus]KAJ0499027.1 hypothetical protein HanHA89_Chr13g0529581 [Helianthus annuus]KAJ0665041.1 hypothetical protein HanLR1_Chr13g0499611 [Helianthus annuus]
MMTSSGNRSATQLGEMGGRPWHSLIGQVNLRFCPALKLRLCHQYKIMFLSPLKNKFAFLLLAKNFDFAIG